VHGIRQVAVDPDDRQRRCGTTPHRRPHSHVLLASRRRENS
jgi:hypothetical protein